MCTAFYKVWFSTETLYSHIIFFPHIYSCWSGICHFTQLCGIGLLCNWSKCNLIVNIPSENKGKNIFIIIVVVQKDTLAVKQLRKCAKCRINFHHYFQSSGRALMATLPCHYFPLLYCFPLLCCLSQHCVQTWSYHYSTPFFCLVTSVYVMWTHPQ